MSYYIVQYSIGGLAIISSHLNYCHFWGMYLFTRSRSRFCSTKWITTTIIIIMMIDDDDDGWQWWMTMMDDNDGWQWWWMTKTTKTTTTTTKVGKTANISFGEPARPQTTSTYATGNIACDKINANAIVYNEYDATVCKFFDLPF
jgi:hypothetical protein